MSAIVLDKYKMPCELMEIFLEGRVVAVCGPLEVSEPKPVSKGITFKVTQDIYKVCGL